MATVLREVERPPIFDTVPECAGPPLSERLRRERLVTVSVAEARQISPVELRQGGEATLDELLVGAWEGLSAHRSVACPVCRGSLQPQGHGNLGGGCSDCGAVLS